MAPKLDWLQGRLDLDDAQLKNMVMKMPKLLSYSIEDNMEPKLQWLQTRIAGASAKNRTTAQQHGDARCSDASVWTRHLRKMELQRRGQPGAEAGLAPDAPRSGRLGARKMVLGLPALLSYSVEDNLEPPSNGCRTTSIRTTRGSKEICTTASEYAGLQRRG